MSDKTTTDYITKTEAAQEYRRSERSISRDITNALRRRDQRILSHVEMRLEDGSRRTGMELTIQEIVALRDKGLNPTWLLQTEWLKQHYGRRDEPRSKVSAAMPEPFDEDSLQATVPLPVDASQRVAVLAAENSALRQSNADLRTQATRLEKELDRRAEERREETQLQKQNNVLLQQVYNMLENKQDSAGQITLLPAPRPASEVQVYEPVNSEAKSVASRKGTQSSTAKPSTNDARVSKLKKRGRARQSQPSAQPEPKPAPSTMSKYLPTIDRAVRSIFRR